MSLASAKAPAVRVGWCPGVLRPMQAGDGLLVRIKPRGSRMTTEVLRVVAGLAERYGNGAMTLTSRGNLQLRGVQERGLPPITAALDDLGLLDASPEGEAVRNVVTSPFSRPGDVVARAAAALEDRLAADPALWRLPAKIGWAVDGPGAMALGPIGADVHATVAADGRGWVRVADALPAGAVPPGGLPDTALRLADAFLTLAAAAGLVPHRFREIVDRFGAEALLRHAGLLPADADVAPSPRLPIGAYRQGEAFGMGLAFPFGLVRSATLRRIAEVAAAGGIGAVRLTPWRVMLLPGLTDGTGLDGAGAIAAPDDPRLSVAACVGAPGCPRATTPVPADAARVAAALSSSTPGAIVVHVSGCGKGCAHAGRAPATLVGREGAYDLVLGGRAGDAPVRLRLQPEAVATMLPDLLAAPNL